MDKSKIEWTDATWNPIRGCSRVSEGCRNCYAERVAHRFNGKGLAYEGLTTEGKWNGKIAVIDHAMDQPLRWKRPRRIFVNSMSDLFHENVKDETIDAIFAVMALAPRHTFQILTKRPKRMRDYLGSGSYDSERRRLVWNMKVHMKGKPVSPMSWPLSNVWLGVSTEDQKTADERIPLLLETPAAVRWISAEPLIGALSLEYFVGTKDIKVTDDIQDAPDGAVLGRYERHGDSWEPSHPGIDWVVAGGESGRGARPMGPDWARLLRNQCVAAGVAFFFKQWGEWSPADPRLDGKPEVKHKYLSDEGDGSPCMFRIGKKEAGRLIDGKKWDEFPAGVRA